MQVQDLPALNATLNSISTILLLTGYYFIRRREIERHKLTMLLAFATSCLFLTSYLVYHYSVPHVPFEKEGWIRPVYYTILASHVILAATVPVLAGVTLFRAWRGQFAKHRKIAKWTWPIWMYVSVTGVVVYVMLYEI